MIRFLLLLSLLIPSFLQAAPSVFFLDHVRATKTGWSQAYPNRGAAVTLWARGAPPQWDPSSYVSLQLQTPSGSGPVYDLNLASDYPVWAVPAANPYLQEITFYVNGTIPDGWYWVTLTTVDGTSKKLELYVGMPGRLLFLDFDAPVNGDGSYEAPWNNFAAMKAALQPGDTVYWDGEVFGKQNSGAQVVAAYGLPSGTETMPIVMAERPDGDAFINGRYYDIGVTGWTRDCFTAAGLEHWTWSKFRLECHAWGFANGGPRPNYSRFVGMDIDAMRYYTGGAAHIVVGGDGIEIMGNGLHGGRTQKKLDHAIYIEACSPNEGVKAKYNYVYDNDFGNGALVVVNHQQTRCGEGEILKNHYIVGNIIDATNYPTRAIQIHNQGYNPGEALPGFTYVLNNVAINAGIIPGTYPVGGAFSTQAQMTVWAHNLCQNCKGYGFYGGENSVELRFYNNIMNMDPVHGTVYDRHLSDHQYLDINTNIWGGIGTYEESTYQPWYPSGPYDVNPISAVALLNPDFSLQPGSPGEGVAYFLGAAQAGDDLWEQDRPIFGADIAPAQ